MNIIQKSTSDFQIEKIVLDIHNSVTGYPPFD